MAVTETELNEALSRAALLMSPHGQQAINAASKRNANNFGVDGSYTQPYGSHGLGKTNGMSKQRPISSQVSNLPKVIQESIMQNPLDDYSSEYSTEGSVLDTINYKPYSATQTTDICKEEYMYERKTTPLQAPPQYYQQQPTLGIDYNYIKAIVNECIQANMERIKEEILKESSLKTLRLGSENKIQLIDNKNNLYESKLEFKRNISKK